MSVERRGVACHLPSSLPSLALCPHPRPRPPWRPFLPPFFYNPLIQHHNHHHTIYRAAFALRRPVAYSHHTTTTTIHHLPLFKEKASLFVQELPLNRF